MEPLNRALDSINIKPCSVRFRSWLKIIVLCTAMLTALIGCSSDSVDFSDEIISDVISSAIFLNGTVNEAELALNNSIGVKSFDAQRRSFSYNTSGEYIIDQLPGTGPWILSVNLNQDRSLYGIVYADGTRNINSFSDISLRRWFALQSLDIDEEFASNRAFQRLPSSVEYDATVTSIFVLIDLVLASYQISGNDVISTPYSNNDQGIDAFLNRNSVVLEDGLITFQVTDPDTQIKSETATAFEIGENLAESGEAPTTPGSVRAITTPSNSVRLAWEPSVDDVGVVGYVVARDETVLGTTPFPQFVDTTLDSINPASRYVIVAFDGAGNRSLPSTPVSPSLISQADTVAPPAPTQLSLLSKSNTAVRLRWLPPTAADIASYNIYRNEIDSAASLLQAVAITSATDTNIQDEVLYCYRVSAVDGSNNESALSDEICTPVINDPNTDSPLTSPTPNPDPTQNPTTEISGTVGDWTLVDVDALNCASTLTQDQLTVGRTELTSGCYFVPESIELNSGVILTIAQGVVLKFERDAVLTVQDGTLTALGTKQNPIVFTGIESEPGTWGGIEFLSNSSGNALDGVVVQYGGGGNVRAAVSTRANGTRFRMQNTLVRRNEGSAISFNSFDIRVEDFTGNRIQDNDRVGDVIATEIHTLVGNNDYIDNTFNAMSVTRREYDNADVIMPNFGITISWAGIEINEGSLTIQPGADLEMIGRIVVQGEFNAVGTADQPIIIQGRSASTVGWDGIVLSGAGDKTINHLFLIGAGANSPTTGAIEIDCRRGEPFSVTVSNTDIIDSESWGIYAEGSSCSYNIGPNVTFTNTALGETNLP